LGQPAAGGKNTIRKIRDKIKADGRDALTTLDGKQVSDAYGTHATGGHRVVVR
jgi:hypothetical protein